MKVLLTGATGYIGKRLLPILLDGGHTVYCVVRNKERFYLTYDYKTDNVVVIECDLLNKDHLSRLPSDIDIAYYLVHSMSSPEKGFVDLEKQTAENFSEYLKDSSAKQLIYLGGIYNDENLSPHLESRRNVENILKGSGVNFTILRSAIIVGSGSASFEIIRDLVEKLPVMITPKWLNTKCQPIAIRNVIEYMVGVAGNPESFNKVFDIGGPEVLTYREMLLQFAEVRGIKRYIITLPVLSPRLSSYWLYFVTSTSFKLASHLVGSMKNEVVCKIQGIEEVVPTELITYKMAVSLAFKRIEQNFVVSSWKDALVSSYNDPSILNYIEVPTFGCFKDIQVVNLKNNSEGKVIENIWAIGGERGWYFGNFLWRIRGFLDKIVGGVGLRRGRTSPVEIHAGDALDFWRVLLADKTKRRLLLFAEMKLPGEAWLEFRIKESKNRGNKLVQTATFRPRGLFGRLYWYSIWPIHKVLFPLMAKNIVNY